MSSAPPGESLNPQNTLQQVFFSDQLQLHVPDSDSDTDTDISDISNNLPSNSDCDSMFDLEEIAPSQTTISQVLSIRVAAPRPPVATKKRQPHNILKNSRLDYHRVALLDGVTCPCARLVGGKNCLSHFSIGDIYGLRFANRNLSAQDEYGNRQRVLQQAVQLNKDKCMIAIKGHLVCLTAYCLIFDYNRTSMSRSWRRILRGIGVQSTGRPKGSKASEIPFNDPRALLALEWLRVWIDSFAETSPVGLKCQKSINYILVGDMYNEYLKDQARRTVYIDSNPISEKLFRKVWNHLKQADGIHVRRNANASTKCDMCDELHKRYIDINATKQDLENIRHQRTLHIACIMNLRSYYMADVERAMRDYRFQTVAFDGTNSNTCKCPLSWRSQMRDEQPEGTYLQQKIQSVLIHGKVLVFYVVPPYVANGMNLSVSTVLDSLQYLDPRTEVVRFQFDGKYYVDLALFLNLQDRFSLLERIAEIYISFFAGGSENVNYGIHILMGLLIESGVFLEIFCNRLPPG